MSILNPILVLDRVIAEYRDYLRSEFRAKDPGLRESLERELDKPLFLAQEPFFQAHRPFKAKVRWQDLPIDPRLARVMKERAKEHGSLQPEHSYLHQSGAISLLLGPKPSPVVVTTGTGSGKTEAFLLPVIQNAIDDAVRYKKSGLTAILVYPMNALANDQAIRIREYLQGSGFGGAIDVRQYDRGTSQDIREEMRRNPPHILLTNYMMLEYLLVRPADRDDIFANHRCRFLVLDEIHTYRGTLGSNIAMLVRRLKTHLAQARQDWKTDVAEEERKHRFPVLIPVGTSATIKSVLEEGRTREEVIRLRDDAVRDFFGKLTGSAPETIQVFGEEVESIDIPAEAQYPENPLVMDHNGFHGDEETLKKGLTALATGSEETLPLEEAVRKSRLLWNLNQWLIKSPLPIGRIADLLQESVDSRKGVPRDQVIDEVESALVYGSAVPDGVPGGLRLRAHRFIRGGWRFHRCVNPECGRLYPMGEEKCQCGAYTAPLYLCRNCGADYLRFVGDLDGGPLRPSAVESDGPEWMLYDFARFERVFDLSETPDDEESDDAPPDPGRRRRTRAIKGRPVLSGSFDTSGLTFSRQADDYPLKVMHAPARTRCLCCEGTAGSRNVITPVALGTSAAVKVLAEGLVEALAKFNPDGNKKKERLLIFSDSRQDAAHQARFIVFSSRYDRMRRRVVDLLEHHPCLTIQKTVEALGGTGVDEQDNPYAPERGVRIYGETLEQIRAWEEAPLLDELAVNAGYRATLVNLGLVSLEYDQLGEYIEREAKELCNRFGITAPQLTHISRCLLDDMRTRGALSRDMLRYHPLYPSCPASTQAAQWERRVKAPRGYVATDSGQPVAFRDSAEYPDGITSANFWRKPGAGGRGPALERILKHLLSRFGGIEPQGDDLVELMTFLWKPCQFIVDVELYGYREKARLLQVNQEAIHLKLTPESERLCCNVCGSVNSGAQAGFPCPKCHGSLVNWRDSEIQTHRAVQRIRSKEIIPLVAAEHTAQVPNARRVKLEDEFKASSEESKMNVLACSPTLELGIDVGGLDAVVLRNIPPRPNNYAQRGGRAGRRARVGVVVGYCRSTPHDQYFFDKPAEMISGEVPTPLLALSNRDVLLRHLNSIVFSLAEPGLGGRMDTYVSPMGEVRKEAVDGLVEAVRAKFDEALSMARSAFGADVFMASDFEEGALRKHLEGLPERIRDVFNRTARQVIELRQALESYYAELRGQRAGTRAGELVARLLGIPTERYRQQTEADDRSAGYPLRRFAEFGILPGYEFPTEPASVRLLGDESEEDAVTVTRRFGLSQFMPEAQVYARTKRWRVIGLDLSSPWNPRSEEPTWRYRQCLQCNLRYNADAPKCPRCGDSSPAKGLPAAAYGGFLARRDESPVLDEEERYAAKNLVEVYPQWDGKVVGRWTVGAGWTLRGSQGEQVFWLNEGPKPKSYEVKAGIPVLHSEAKGFLLCPACGNVLTPPVSRSSRTGGRRQLRTRSRGRDPFGHRDGCSQAGLQPQPQALVTSSPAEVLRLLIPVPRDMQESVVKTWGYSLGYSLLIGMQRLYMIDATELDFELEGPWKLDTHLQVALAFIDPSLGGTGYLHRIAGEFNQVAKTAIEHLDHSNCESACYRCLKSYRNQRHHEYLQWPLVMPHLQTLAESGPILHHLDVKDFDDPKPWLEAYSAGVGSPLELQFLRLFEKHGFHPEKQVPLSANVDEPPITVADFAVPGRRLAIYIDGAAFHVGNNLRRDRYIRGRLRSSQPPWRVEELAVRDLRMGGELVRRLMT